MPVQITARRDGFRRLGIVHSARTVTYPDGHFSKAELVILKTDPNLIVIEVAEVIDTAASAEALSEAQARITELEAGMTQLIQDADALKSANSMLMDLRDEQKRRIDQQQSEIMALTTERDALQVKLATAASGGKDTAESAAEDTSGKKKG